MVFDKTGTLTLGELGITDIVSINNYSRDEILQIAASLESRSKHPVAKHILNEALKEKLSLKNVEDFSSITGKCISGKIEGKTFYVGKISLYNGEMEYPIESVKKLEDEGKTAVLVGNQDHIIGIIALMDGLRDSSPGTIHALKEMGIKTAMLTGDNHGTAKAGSLSIGIEQYYSELLPEDKVKIIEELSKQHEDLAMVGDGVNDVPALARANVGIAMGAAGSDVAIETADVVLMQEDLSKLNYLFNLSRKTMAVIKENVTVSIFIKSSFAVLTIFGLVTLWMAVAIGDMGLSLAVIFKRSKNMKQSYSKLNS
jgi:Cd2+/Zn2+-exporting ATPase